MRISHIIWSLTPGGVETMLVDIINVQVQSENVSLLIVNKDIDDNLYRAINKKCDIICCNRSKGSKCIIPWIKLNIALFKFQPDIIHCHLEGMRKMIIHPAPKVFTVHNTHTSGREYNRFDGLFAISNAVRDYTLKQGFNSTVVYNGIHPENILSKAPNNPPSKPFKIVCIGRLYSPHKGQDILLKALSIMDTNCKFDYHIDFIGDGPSKYELELLVKNLHLEDRVSFLGAQTRDYIYTRLCEYDLFVQPSRLEGFGLTVAEACCAKVPVLISKLDGPMEIIGYQYGYTFEPNNPIDLAQKLLNIGVYGIDTAIVNRAYDFVTNNFNVSNTALNYIKEYHSYL